MTIYHFDPIEDGFAGCTVGGKIRTKFVAVGEIVAIGPYQRHGQLVQKLLAGPLSHLPADLAAATSYVLEHGIPVTCGNVLQNGEVVFLTDPEHDVNVSREHAESVRSALDTIAHHAA